MKLGFIGDLHVGNHKQQGGPLSVGQNERCRQTLRAVTAAGEICRVAGCDATVVLGDVFDTPKPLPQQLVAFTKAIGQTQGPVFLLVGNHDRVSNAPGDHGLGPLHGVGGIRVIDKPQWTVQGQGEEECLLGLCPFDERPVLEWLEKFLQDKPRQTGLLHPHSTKGLPALLTGHFGLYDQQAPAWLKSGHDAAEVSEVAKLLAAHGVGWLFVGNYHTRGYWKEYNVELCQVGALVPTGWDNPGWSYGGVDVWTAPNKRQRTEVPGPRFLVVRSAEELDRELLEAKKRGCPVYIDWRTTPDDYEQAAERARFFSQGPVNVEVHVDREHATQQARAAAGAARSHVTLEEAAAAFIEKMPLNASVERARVLGHCKRFLGL